MGPRPVFIQTQARSEMPNALSRFVRLAAGQLGADAPLIRHGHRSSSALAKKNDANPNLRSFLMGKK